MKFRYIGPDEDAPKQTNFMGKIRFKKGEVKEVTDPMLCEKLKGNPSFELVGKDVPVSPDSIEEEIEEEPVKKPARGGRGKKAA